MVIWVRNHCYVLHAIVTIVITMQNLILHAIHGKGKGSQSTTWVPRTNSFLIAWYFHTELFWALSMICVSNSMYEYVKKATERTFGNWPISERSRACSMGLGAQCTGFSVFNLFVRTVIRCGSVRLHCRILNNCKKRSVK